MGITCFLILFRTNSRAIYFLFSDQGLHQLGSRPTFLNKPVDRTLLHSVPIVCCLWSEECCHYQKLPAFLHPRFILATSHNRRANSNAPPPMPGRPCSLREMTFNAATKGRTADSNCFSNFFAWVAIKEGSIVGNYDRRYMKKA